MQIRLEQSERGELMGPNYEPMTREVAIEKISKVEEKKIEYVAGMIVLANTG